MRLRDFTKLQTWLPGGYGFILGYFRYAHATSLRSPLGPLAHWISKTDRDKDDEDGWMRERAFLLRALSLALAIGFAGARSRSRIRSSLDVRGIGNCPVEILEKPADRFGFYKNISFTVLYKFLTGFFPH